jgi:ABC-2 type transport system permease protein
MTRAATRYLRLFFAQVRASATESMQYRVDFLIQGAMSFVWLGYNLIPLLVLFQTRDTVAGWDFPSALLVIGYFTILRGVLDGAINPSLIEVIDRIRTGAFDFVLLKPADAQFLVSTTRFQPWKLVDVVGGVMLMGVAFARLGRAPDALDVLAGVTLLGAGILVLYALWILVIAAAFWVVRLDNLTHLFSAIFDAARWPVHIFRGAWRALFTFVIPLALMTTYPAMGLLGRLDAKTVALCVAGAVAVAGVARAVWSMAIARYTSAA